MVCSMNLYTSCGAASEEHTIKLKYFSIVVKNGFYNYANGGGWKLMERGKNSFGTLILQTIDLEDRSVVTFQKHESLKNETRNIVFPTISRTEFQFEFEAGPSGETNAIVLVSGLNDVSSNITLDRRVSIAAG